MFIGQTACDVVSYRQQRTEHKSEKGDKPISSYVNENWHDEPFFSQ